MSSYRNMDQDLPAYGQPSYGYELPTGQQETVLQRTSRENAPPRVRDGDGKDGILGPGEIEDEALNLNFDKCFYEHESTKTLPELMAIVGLIYKYVKLVVYHGFVVVIGIPMALIWAILNGIMVFILVWLYQPLLRIMIMWIYALAPWASVPLQAIYAPIVDAHARIFRQIRVKATLDGSFAERLAGQTPAQSSV